MNTVVGGIALAGGVFGLFYATVGRLLGFHRPRMWQSGGEISLVAELATSCGFATLGVGFLSRSPVWALPFLACWLIGFVSQRKARRRYVAEYEALRTKNALDHPGIFDSPPPQDIDAVEADEMDLYDYETCTYIGRAPKSDVKAIIQANSDIPEQGPNDIFLMVDTFDYVPIGGISEKTSVLLKSILEERDDLVLRWLPASIPAPVQTTTPDQ